jgi:hypothetical protein
MSSIKYHTAPSQAVLQVFDFPIYTRHVFIESHNSLVEVIQSRIPFDGVLCLALKILDLEPERELSDSCELNLYAQN